MYHPKLIVPQDTRKCMWFHSLLAVRGCAVHDKSLIINFVIFHKVVKTIINFVNKLNLN